MILADFKLYFKAIATSHVDVARFQYGGLERILSRNAGPDQKYPLLFLEKPSYTFEGDAYNIQGKPRAAFVVLKNANIGDSDEQDAVEQEMFDIVRDIIAKLLKDYKDGEIRWFLPSGIKIDPIDTITLDGDLGWRVEFALMDDFDFCPNPLKFT